MPPLVSASGLTKRYGDLVAVAGIDFEIQEGECFGFLGPNGAGKTTTVRMIHCVSPRDRGHAHGRRPARRPIDNRALKKITGVIPQEINLDNDLTVSREPGRLRPLLRHRPPRGQAPDRRAPELRRARGQGREQDLGAVDGHEAAPAHRPGPDQPAAGHRRRRADDRARSPGPPPHLAEAPPAQEPGDDARPDDPVHGGGPAALRPARRHVPGPDPQGRDSVAARRGGDRPGGRRGPPAAGGGRPDPRRAGRRSPAPTSASAIRSISTAGTATP